MHNNACNVHLRTANHDRCTSRLLFGVHIDDACGSDNIHWLPENGLGAAICLRRGDDGRMQSFH
jgi:hypothetical protein